MLKELVLMAARAEMELATATTTESSEEWYRQYLGRTGEITSALRGLGQLSREERPAVGKAANEIKQRLEAALPAAQSQAAE